MNKVEHIKKSPNIILEGSKAAPAPSATVSLASNQLLPWKLLQWDASSPQAAVFYNNFSSSIKKLLYGNQTGSIELKKQDFSSTAAPAAPAAPATVATSSHYNAVQQPPRDADLQRRLNKMSWGEGGGASGGRALPKAGGGLGKAFVKLIWFSAKVGAVTGLCYWTAKEGLWGSFEETKAFQKKLEEIINKLPTMLNMSDRSK